MTNSQVVYKLASSIPKGKVSTYGKLAKLAGIKSPRVVGNILHKNEDTEKIPCHRVVNSRGRLSRSFAFGGAEGQTRRLENEGVEVKDGRVDLNKFLWKLI
jgi:O-6-methylguanine DNA methyltransferase